MTQQWRIKSSVVLLTNCSGFPAAPWVNYVSFKYFVPAAEYSPLSGVYCVEIQHLRPPRSSFPLHDVHMCVWLYPLQPAKTSEKEKSSPTRTRPVPKNASSHNRPPPQEIRSGQRSGQEKAKTTTGAGVLFFGWQWNFCLCCLFTEQTAQMLCIQQW